MSQSKSLSARWTRLRNRLAARRAGRGQPVTAFVSQPEPRSIGYLARGRQLCAGNFVFAGHLVEAPDTMIWDIPAPDAEFTAEMHGFGWLDDLAAAGDAAARDRAQAWLMEWIARYGRGRGPGWTPDLAGRRLIRWISNALFLMRGQSAEESAAFLRALARQARFLSWRWHAATPGLKRLEALTGLVHAGVSLEGMAPLADEARDALARECASCVDDEGGIPGRNPEVLLEVFTLLTWAALVLSENGRTAADAHWRAVERIAPCLRALRHADGGLARFHGGGRGLDGRLDAALAASGVKAQARGGRAMGYARLARARTSLIIDAAPPPAGPAADEAHASTLAFELTSGRRPLIVGCGSGAPFGAAWRRAGRATPSHSVIGLDGYSSSRLGAPRRHLGEVEERLTELPSEIILERSRHADGMRIELAHDGYRPRFGLTCGRIVDLGHDGREVSGEDILTTRDDDDTRLFDAALDRTGLKGLAWSIRFHLHPDVEAELDLGGSAVSLVQKSGEIWVLRHDGTAELSLEPSVYFERGRLRPRAARQMVLSGRALSYATRIRWSLAKAQDTPFAWRDLVEDDPFQDLESEEL